MIRQPDFVTTELVSEIKSTRLASLAPELVDNLQFETIKEGRNLQMMHVGSYADEIYSFNKMDDYCKEMNLKKSVISIKKFMCLTLKEWHLKS